MTRFFLAVTVVVAVKAASGRWDRRSLQAGHSLGWEASFQQTVFFAWSGYTLVSCKREVIHTIGERCRWMASRVFTLGMICAVRSLVVSIPELSPR